MLQNRSILSLLVIFATFIPALSNVGEEAVSEFLKRSGLPSKSVAVKIIDLADGKTVAIHNDKTPLVPASIMKSVTTAALLESTGPDWRYHTRVYVDGPNDLGYLRGNVIVEGACDPTVNSEKEPFSEDLIEEICIALNNQMINRIEGHIIIDENNFAGSSRPSSWAKEDWNKYYGTGSHAFNYSDNANGDHAVNNPSNTFISLLKRSLESNGIELEGKDMTEGRRMQIHDHVSAPIDEIMRSCMMRSDNLFAESMLRTYGKLQGCDGSTKEATTKVMALWEAKQFPLEGVTIVDGSGLSRSNRVTADFMTELLKSMSDNPNYASFFPLAGQEGTLKKFLAGTSLDSYIAMKTGSMKGIQCYAGYKLDEEYIPTHVIVIIMNEITKNRDRAKQAAEKMLLKIFDN